MNEHRFHHAFRSNRSRSARCRVRGFTLLESLMACGVLLVFSGMSITAGYHRLWSHRTYKAAWPLRLFLAIFGTFSLQN
jgi:fatty-acid desaturase